MVMKRKLIYFILLFIFYISGVKAKEVPTTIDSRMKTIIYNANEVFELKFFYGFQSFIEFSDDEEIEIISLGEAYPWKLTPIGKRLFIRPMQINVNTNMTIITTKRTYQFQIKSGNYEDGADEELIYSVKFFYPDTTKKEKIVEEVIKKETVFSLNRDDPNLNFEYFMTGNIQELAPLKTFDNGINTYFQFRDNNNNIPLIFAVDINGNETRLDYTMEDEFVVVNTVQMQFSFRIGNALLCIFNNKIINK